MAQNVLSITQSICAWVYCMGVPDAGAVGPQSIGGWIQHIVTSCGEIILRFDTKSEYGSAQTIPRQWSGESTGS